MQARTNLLRISLLSTILLRISLLRISLLSAILLSAILLELNDSPIGQLLAVLVYVTVILQVTGIRQDF